MKEQNDPDVRTDAEGASRPAKKCTPQTEKKKADAAQAKTQLRIATETSKKPDGAASAPPKEKKVRVVKKNPNSTAFAFVFTTVYLLLVITAAVLLSIFALDVANEAFALQKEGETVTFTLTGDYISVEDLAQQLKQQHIIKHSAIFSFYAKLRHKADAEFLPGSAEVTPDMGYDDLLALFVPQPEERKQIAVAVPEGYTVDDIINLFVSKGIGTREAFEYVINEYPLSADDYWFLEGVEMKPGRIYRLEGYLYPDTYFFYDSYPDKAEDIPGTAAAKAVVFKMLNEFKKNFKKYYLTRYQKYLSEAYPDMPVLTLDEIITLASILEKEGLPAERATISAVFYNRLNSPDYESIGTRLESNATVLYAMRHNGETIGEEFTDREKTYPSPYNTYENAGLPPGPIVSPSVDSINAALYPEKNCPYFYFVATDSHYSFFAATLAEHEENVKKARAGEVADPYNQEEDWGDEQ